MDPLSALLLAILHVLQSLQTPSGIHGSVTFGSADAPASNVVVACTARDRSASREATTDLDGRYQCILPPGLYRVSARVLGDEIRYLSQVFGGSDLADEGQTVRVRAKTGVQVDFALKAAGSISGRVLDPDGTPIRNAVVTVSPETGDNDPLVLGAAGRGISVGESGSFSIAGLPTGLYRLSVEPPERGNTPDNDGRSLATTWYPGVADPRKSIPLQIVEGGDVSGIDLTLLRAKPVRIAGRVTRADGSWPANGTLMLVERDARSVSNRPVSVDASGGFSLSSVRPGDYELVATASGPTAETANERIAVGDYDITDLRVILGPTAVVSGRVRFEGGEFPWPSLTVIALSGFKSLNARTNERWEFELSPLPEPQVIRIGGLPPDWSLERITANGRDITNYAEDLSTGLSNVEIVVSRAMSTLKGFVRSGDGELPADTAVVIFSADPNEWRRFTTTLRRVWPSSDGAFEIAGLPPGRYNVVAVDRTPSRMEQNPAPFLASVVGQSSPVTIGERDHVEVALTVRSYRD